MPSQTVHEMNINSMKLAVLRGANRVPVHLPVHAAGCVLGVSAGVPGVSKHHADHLVALGHAGAPLRSLY